MQVGVLKEIKRRENRVAMTPAGVEQMIARGDVRVQGVVPPETAIDPDIFVAELAKRRIEIHERVGS